MMAEATKLGKLVEEAGRLAPFRVAVVDAAQRLVIETVREAHALSIVEPLLVGDPAATRKAARELAWTFDESWLVPAPSDVAAATTAAKLVRDGKADVVMKGNVHTDELMRALLDKQRGLRVPGQRVSHVFVCDIPRYPKLLGITDAAINIAPDLEAKAQILRNAVELFQLLGKERPKVAVLSAVETVNPAIPSTIDAASLTLMARRGQIGGAQVDGPLAFDNAISAEAAAEKGILSEVAGGADIVLVPDLESGNILAKNLELLAGAVAAGLVTGLAVPVVLSSRADPPASRLAGLALAGLVHHRSTQGALQQVATVEPSLVCAPQPEHACCPLKE